MPKWEYCRITCADEVKELAVAPAGKINLEWVKQQFPNKVKIKKAYGADYIIGLSGDDLWNTYYAIIEHLCSLGWEPFAASRDTLVHLKRICQE